MIEEAKKREDLLKSIIKTCPKCGSKNITVAEYHDIMCMTCKKCGYDERELYDVAPEERALQKAKGSAPPYKAGGAKRTQKTSQKGSVPNVGVGAIFVSVEAAKSWLRRGKSLTGRCRNRQNIEGANRR